jgi:diaminopimelate epimerase
MRIPFFKYQGAGNDFIIIDEREALWISESGEKHKTISFLCDRRFGIGADGLMLLRKHPAHDFQMIYYNSDGYEGSMCGNGGRCLVAFAAKLNVITNNTLFWATDGLHKAEIIGRNGEELTISLQMKDVSDIKLVKDGFFLDTGSPHYVVFLENIDEIDVFTEGRKLRYDPIFGEGGTNVNFARISNDLIHIRTYERGVENETLACGTGITATAIAAFHGGKVGNINRFNVKALGGELKVSFQNPGLSLYQEVFLEGPAKMVYQGEIEL